MILPCFVLQPGQNRGPISRFPAESGGKKQRLISQLEPKVRDKVFEILADLQHRDGKTIVMVEQNAKKGLEFADIGYVLVSGRLALAGPGDALLEDPEVGRLFLGA